MAYLRGMAVLVCIAVTLEARSILSQCKDSYAYWRTPCGGCRTTTSPGEIDWSSVATPVSYGPDQLIVDINELRRNLRTLRELYTQANRNYEPVDITNIEDIIPQNDTVQANLNSEPMNITNIEDIICRNDTVPAGDDQDAIYRHTQNLLAGFAPLVETVYEEELRTALLVMSTNGPHITRLLGTVRANLSDTLCRLTEKLNQNPAVSATSLAAFDVSNLHNFTKGDIVAIYGLLVMGRIQEALLSEIL